MNDIKNDKNLREAVSRREQQLPPIPDDLNERVVKSLVEPETAPRSRRLWVYAAVAAAASIALLIVFNWGKQQSPQEPVVAQTNEKVSPLQPPPEGEAPPLREGAGGEAEQPEGKPVSARSEDAPQQAEPASTEDVSPLQSPLEGEVSPLWEGTGGKAEPLFLASTSYMVTHRRYRDGLATSESEDGSAFQLSTKTVSQNRPQRPQIPLRKLTKKERKQVAVLGAIADKRWHIDINSMNTMRYGSRTVTSDFYLELRGDTLFSYLPYLGQVQISTMSPSIGLNFEEPVLTYKESKPKSKYTQVDIDVKTREDSYHYVIEIYDNGQAYIRVRSMNRDPISFDGTLEIE